MRLWLIPIALAPLLYIGLKYNQTYGYVFHDLKMAIKGEKKLGTTDRCFWKKASWKHVLWIGLGALFISLYLGGVSETIANSLTETHGTVDPDTHPQGGLARISPFLLLVVVTVMAIPEEILIRGWLLDFLEKKMHWIPALLISSFWFALLHLVDTGTFVTIMIPTFIGGLVYGAAYLHGGLTSSVIAHVGRNFMVVLPLIIKAVT